MFWQIVLLCIGVRVALEIVGVVSLTLHGEPVLSNALELWRRWDANHYLRLAEVGYRTGTPPPDDPLFIVFFPFFPLAVRIVSVLARDLVASGLAVSFLASVGATWLLYRIVALDRSEEEAWRAVVLLLSFPTAYFLAAPYSEALFLFAVLASVYAARTGRWARSGLAGALATGTRVTGVALLPALIAEAMRGRLGIADRGRRLAWVAASGTGLLIYLAINQLVHNDPLWFLEVQRMHWFQHAVPPWQSIIDGVRGMFEGSNDSTRTLIFVGRTVAFAFALSLLVIAVRRLRVADTLYAWSGFVLILSTAWLISLPRYLLVLYPLFVVGAQLTRSKRVFIPIVVGGTALQVALFSRYAVGKWTF